MSNKINLEDHKVYIETHKMEMVPFSTAVKAVQEAYEDDSQELLDALDTAISNLSVELTSLNPTLEELNDKNSTRKS